MNIRLVEHSTTSIVFSKAALKGVITVSISKGGGGKTCLGLNLDTAFPEYNFFI